MSIAIFNYFRNPKFVQQWTEFLRHTTQAAGAWPIAAAEVGASAIDLAASVFSELVTSHDPLSAGFPDDRKREIVFRQSLLDFGSIVAKRECSLVVVAQKESLATNPWVRAVVTGFRHQCP